MKHLTTHLSKAEIEEEQARRAVHMLDEPITLPDSGKRTRFSTGGQRELGGKGRCDLLPLSIVSKLLGDDEILLLLDRYIYTGEVAYMNGAIEAFCEQYYEDTETAMLETAIHFEDGARKYADRNWELGLPLHCFIDSAVRHYLKVLRGDTDEPHDRAFLFNMLCALWTHANKPELNDLPFAAAEGVEPVAQDADRA